MYEHLGLAADDDAGSIFLSFYVSKSKHLCMSTSASPPTTMPDLSFYLSMYLNLNIYV